MEVTRRGFLKATGLGTTIALGFDVSTARAEMRELKISRTTETRSTCPYCAVSCGVIIHTLGDKAKNATAVGRPRRGRSRSSRSTAGRSAPRARRCATTSTTRTGC